MACGTKGGLVSLLTAFPLILNFLIINEIDALDFKCNDTQKMNRIASRFRNGERSYKFGCGSFSITTPAVKNLHCSSRPTLLKCDGSEEGCPEGQFLAGIRTYDAGEGLKMIAPYCCRGDNAVSSSCRDAENANFEGEPYEYTLRDAEVMNIKGCWLISDSNGRLYDVILKISTCLYTVEGQESMFTTLG